MSAYSYETFIKDFAERTWKNYEKILHAKEDDERNRYEVTQLINSLFGLLIVPNEKYKYRRNHANGIKENVLRRTEEYKHIKNLICTLKENHKLSSSYDEYERYEVSNFIKHLRNSLAHSGNHGINFFPVDEGNEITGVYFYDTNETSGEEFCVRLSICEIHLLAKNISGMYSSVDTKNVSENVAIYDADIDKCKKLLEDN